MILISQSGFKHRQNNTECGKDIWIAVTCLHFFLVFCLFRWRSLSSLLHKSKYLYLVVHFILRWFAGRLDIIDEVFKTFDIQQDLIQTSLEIVVNILTWNTMDHRQWKTSL